jgi:hypothetical protein
MHPSEKSPYANVFGAFSKGLEEGRRAGAAENPEPGPEGGFDTLRALTVLGDAPEHSMPFAQFATYVPGDSIATLTSTVKLMRDGWVEFVGSVSEQGEVRLTSRGREMLETLKGAAALA